MICDRLLIKEGAKLETFRNLQITIMLSWHASIIRHRLITYFFLSGYSSIFYEVACHGQITLTSVFRREAYIYVSVIRYMTDWHTPNSYFLFGDICEARRNLNEKSKEMRLLSCGG